MHQMNRFEVLMSDYSSSVTLYDNALNSAGTTQQKYNLWMQGTEAQMLKLKAVSEQLWLSIYNSETINSAIQGFTDFVKTIDIIVEKMGALPTIISAVTIALSTGFLLSSVATKTRLAELASAILGLNFSGVTSGFKNLASVVTTLGMGANATKLSVAGLNAALGSIAILAIGIPYVIGKMNEESEKAKTNVRELTGELQQFKVENSALNKLISEQKDILGENNDITKLSTEEKQKLHDIEVKLAQILPDATTGYDKEGQALAGNIKLTEELIKRKKEEALITAQTTINSMDIDKVMKDADSKWRRLQQLVAIMESPDKDAEYSSLKYGRQTGKDAKELASKEATEIKQQYTDMVGSMNGWFLAVNTYNSLSEKQISTRNLSRFGIIKETQALEDNTKAQEKNTQSVFD
jgi:phosphoribosylcarboxyaminoimidazole (NCAIR) mutase